MSPSGQAEVRGAVGDLALLSPREKLDLFLGDFRLLETETYLQSRLLGDISTETLRSIMDWCFLYADYVPMLYFNRRFVSDYQVCFPVPVCPNVSLSDISGEKIVGYREKIDGTIVRLATVRRGEYQVQCWVGGISCPRYYPSIVSFELRGLEAYSIEPHNLEGSLHSPWCDIVFKTRQVVMEVNPLWAEGAIAYVATSAGLIEKRVKRIVTAEIFLDATGGQIGSVKVPSVVPVPRPGVYECAKYEGKLYPQRYRPWKEPTTNFSAASACPTVFALRPIPLRAVLTSRGPIRASRDTVYVPETVLCAPVMMLYQISQPNVEMRAYQSEEGETPVEARVRRIRDDEMILEASESVLTARSGYEGEQVNFMAFSSTQRSLVTPFGRLWLRPDFPVGSVIMSGRHRLIMGEREWSHLLQTDEGFEKQAVYSRAQVIKSHCWAIFARCMVHRMYPQTIATARSDMFKQYAPFYLPSADQGPSHVPPPLPSMWSLIAPDRGGIPLGTLPASACRPMRYLPPAKLAAMLKTPVRFSSLAASMRAFKMPHTDDELMSTLARFKGKFWDLSEDGKWSLLLAVPDIKNKQEDFEQ